MQHQQLSRQLTDSNVWVRIFSLCFCLMNGICDVRWNVCCQVVQLTRMLRNWLVFLECATCEEIRIVVCSCVIPCHHAISVLSPVVFWLCFRKNVVVVIFQVSLIVIELYWWQKLWGYMFFWADCLLCFPRNLLSRFWTTLLGSCRDGPMINLTALSTFGITTLSTVIKKMFWPHFFTAATKLPTSFLKCSAFFPSGTWLWHTLFSLNVTVLYKSTKQSFYLPIVLNNTCFHKPLITKASWDSFEWWRKFFSDAFFCGWEL